MRAMPASAKACRECSGCVQGRRRTFLQSAVALLLGWSRPSAALAVGQDEAARVRPVAGDRFVRVGDASRTPIAAADVTAGGKPVIAWPMTADAGVVRSGSRLNRVLLVRLEASELTEATRARAVDGVLAFSAVCTHTGCEVGEYLADERQLYCECHQSKFDPRDGAKVTDGPAPRPLPALPLRIEGGRLVVAAPFTSRPGFEQG